MVNKMCGSGMKAAMLAHDLLRAGSARVMVAGGMESMSNAPYLMTKARAGLRLGHGEITPYVPGRPGGRLRQGQADGVFAEWCAEKYGFSREAQDAFAIASLNRAQAAIRDGLFRDEIAPVTVSGRGGEQVVDTDEQPLKANVDKIPTLKPAFKKDGTVTPANASSISDGAAALVLMTAEAARRGLRPLARIVGHATHAQEPGWFTTAPVEAIRKLLGGRAGAPATSISTRSTKLSPW